MKKEFSEELETLLKQNFVDEKGNLLKQNIIDSAEKFDKNLIALLFSNQKIPGTFF